MNLAERESPARFLLHARCSNRMANPDREAIKALLAETLALRLADKLDKHKLPDEVEMGKFRPHVSDSAEIVLANYEKQLAVSAISDAVIDRLRGDLVRRSRVSGMSKSA